MPNNKLDFFELERESITVTKATLPDLDEYVKYLKEIWNAKWITNDGKLLQLFEQQLERYLKINNLMAVSNGTLALQIAIKSLNLKGDIITTPFTFAATTNAILWEGYNPIFADIDPETFNIDPFDVERKITENTKAIMPVQIGGQPCNMERIMAIAKKHNLKVIEDAAQAHLEEMTR